MHRTNELKKGKINFKIGLEWQKLKKKHQLIIVQLLRFFPRTHKNEMSLSGDSYSKKSFQNQFEKIDVLVKFELQIVILLNIIQPNHASKPLLQNRAPVFQNTFLGQDSL